MIQDINSRNLINSINALFKLTSNISTIAKLEKISQIIKNKFERTQIKLVKKINLHLITTTILPKMISLLQDKEIPPKTQLLIEYLKFNDIIPKIFLLKINEIYEKNLDYKYGINFREKEKNNGKLNKLKKRGIENDEEKTLFEGNGRQIVKKEINKKEINKKEINKKEINKKEIKEKKSFVKITRRTIENNISKILRPEEMFKKNFGYSIIDFNGDFIWLDDKSLKFFEFQKVIEKNFFNLLIPFSKQKMISKYCKEKKGENLVFDENSELGENFTFSYVIYSEKNLQKYIKYVKKKGFLDLEKEKKNENKGEIIFFKYLKALSSRITLISLKISEDEYEEIFEKNKYRILKKEIFKDIFKKQKIFYKKAIFLETRFAKKIPNFDYSVMKKDSKIIKFEKVVKKKFY